MKEEKIAYINPENMMTPRGFSQVVTVYGNHKTIYVGGQDAVDENGNTVGKGSLKLQTKQVLVNIEKALAAAGAGLENVIKWNVYLVQGQNPQEGFEVFREKWGSRQNPPTLTVLFVAGLANPEWLIEIDAIAVITE
ncbi:Putative aminoacrylate peracid reductase RutC [Sporomusa rhizae]|uniref:RidA family protein n=1 Tax=Sporomusa rhizae TaxID=357999 RepID=UPI00352B47C7